MSLGHGASVVRDGLVLHLDAANLKSYPGNGTVFSDLLSTYSTTLFNGVSYDTENNGSFVFDGVNDFLRTNVLGKNIFTPQSNFSMEAWVNVTSLPLTESAGTIFGAFNYDGYGIKWGNTLSSVNVGYQMRARLTGTIVDGNIDISTNRWYHLVFTYSSASNFSRFYIDSTKIFDKNAISGSYDTTLDTIYLSMGQNTVASGGIGGKYFPGKMSNFKMYNRALTDSEVKFNFEALRGRYGI